MFNIFLLYLPVAIILIILAIFCWVMIAGSGFGKKKYDEERTSDENYQTDYTRVINVYELLSRFPLTSKSTNQLHDVISGLSIYNDLEQRIETARIAALSYLLMIGIVTITTVIFKGNLVACVATFVIALAFRRDLVNKRLRKKRLKFWNDLLVTLSSLQQEYMRSKSLNTAFNMCQAEGTTRYMLSNIEHILKCDDPEGALTYFCANNPFHICIRLAYLCYNTHTYSPKYIEREGTDSFIDGLDTLIQDLMTEIDLATKEKKKFYTVEKLPLVGLLIVFIGPWFMQKYFSGLRYYYNDGFGFATLAISLLVVLGAYLLATRLNDKDRSQEDVTAWEIVKFEDQKFATYWYDVAGDRVPRFQHAIEKSLSYLTPGMVMMRKSLFGIIFFILTLMGCITYLVIDKHSLETNYKSVPETVLENLESNYQDYNFVIKKTYSDDSIQSKEDMTNYILMQGWNLTDADAALLGSRLYENKVSIGKVGFSILHFLLAFALMLVGFNVPEIVLERRAKMVEQEAKAEVLLLQSVVCQLMYTPLKLKDYLIFFSSISRLYADTHLLCYVNQFNNPTYLRKEAYKMFDPNYYLLMEQLYTLHSSLKPMQIFRQTAASRRYLAAKFLETREEALAVNYSWLSAFLKAALLIPVVLQVVLPLASFVSEALRQYSTMMPQ